MKQFQRYILLVAATLLFATMAVARGAEQFKILSLEGMAKAQSEDGKQLFQLVAGEEYDYGQLIQVARRSSLVLQLSPGNVVTVQPNSILRISAQQKSGRTAYTIELIGGDVEVDFQDENSEFEVKTQVGVVRGKNAAADVTFLLLEDKITHEVRVETTRGEVAIDGGYVATEEDAVRVGGVVLCSLVLCPTKDYVFMPSVMVTGQDIKLAFGRANVVYVTDGTELEAGMLDVPDKAKFVALRIVGGHILVGGVKVDEDQKPVFVRRDRIFKEEKRIGKDEVKNADGFLDLAELLCIRCSKLTGCANCCLFYTDYAQNLPLPEGPSRPRKR